jgi:hypothetical protein
MDRDTSLIRQQLVQQWSEVTAVLERMSPGASVSPSDGWAIIHDAPASSNDLIKFVLEPVVFNVPERGNHSNAGLFIVVEGWLEVRRADFAANSELVTHAFATRAAYFRSHANELEHVYGAHYDVTVDELGHPVFHAQMRSFLELGSHVRTQYQRTDAFVDKVDGVLRNVRVPTAQMDFFSFTLQVFADHLLVRQSGKEVKEAFNTLLQKSEFLRGAAVRSARLSTEAARLCLRSRHWYPVVV